MILSKSRPLHTLISATLAIGCLLMMSASLLAQAPSFAAFKPEKAGVDRFNPAPDWSNLPDFINGSDYYVTVVKSKRDEYQQEIKLTITKPGLMIMAAPIEEPVPQDEISDNSSNNFTFVKPEQYIEMGWEPIARISHKGLDQAIYRKQVGASETETFAVQPNLGPFIFLASKNKEQHAKTVSELKPIPVDQLLPQAETVAANSEKMKADGNTIVTDGGEIEITFSEEGGFPGGENGSQMQPPPGGLVGAFLGFAKALAGGDGPPGVNPGIPTQAIPQPVDKKAAFIQGVTLDEMKCPVDRVQVDRQLHLDHNGGVVFFSSKEAMEKFEKNPLPNTAAANYQLFLTGQATQIRCPLSYNSFEDEFSMSVGYGKSVKFNSQAELSKLNGTEASYKLTKMFGKTPFERAFTVAIPDLSAPVVEPEPVQSKPNGQTINATPSSAQPDNSNAGGGSRRPRD